MNFLRSGFVAGGSLFFLCALAMVAQIRYRIFVDDATLILSWVGAVLLVLSVVIFVRDWVEDWFEDDHWIHKAFARLHSVMWVLVALYLAYALFLFANARQNAPTQSMRGKVATLGKSLTFAEDFARYPWAKIQFADGRSITMLINRGEEARVWPGLAIELQIMPGNLGVTRIVGVTRDREIEYQEILKISPTSTTALIALMQAYAERGRAVDALPLAERYLAFSNDSKPVWYVGAALFQRHKVAESSDFFKLALQKELTRDNTISYGWSLAKQGKREEGLPYIQKGIELDPISDQGYYHLAYVLAELDRKEEALKNFREVLKRRPNFPEIRDKIKSLGGEG